MRNSILMEHFFGDISDSRSPLNEELFGSCEKIDDCYEVYVNNDFIGQKKLYNQNEDIFDLEEFLQEQGISGFETKLDGDHFVIVDASDQPNLKEVLHLYLQSD